MRRRPIFEAELVAKLGTCVLWVNALGHFDMAWLTIEGGQPTPTTFNMYASTVTDKNPIT